METQTTQPQTGGGRCHCHRTQWVLWRGPGQDRNSGVSHVNVRGWGVKVGSELLLGMVRCEGI